MGNTTATKTILVTGGAGFVGRHLRARIDQEGSAHRWIFSDCIELAAQAKRDAQANARNAQSAFIACDLTNIGNVQRLLSETAPTNILHLAGATRVDSAPETRELLFRSNLMSTCNLLEAARRRGPPGAAAAEMAAAGTAAERPVHFILASTGLIYGDQPGPFTERLELRPPNDYSLTKFLAEQTVDVFARQRAVRPCVLRTALLYGPGQVGDMFIPSLIAAVRQGRRFPMTAGAQRRDFVFIADMVDALCLAIDKELEGTYNVGSSAGVAMREVGEVVADLLERRDLLGVGDLPYREREVWEYTLDASRLRAAGWSPRTDLAEGLRKTVNEDGA